MSETLNYLQNRYRANEAEIEALKAKRSKYEQAYDSLGQFRVSVQNSNGEFSQAISSRKEYLSGLNEPEQYCEPIREYHEGMENVLGGLGGKTVLRVFRWMDDHIGRERQSYRNKINDIDREIERLLRDQEGLLIMIREAREMEQED